MAVLARTKAQEKAGLSVGAARDINQGQIGVTTASSLGPGLDIQPGESLPAYQDRIAKYKQNKPSADYNAGKVTEVGAGGAPVSGGSGTMNANITTPSNKNTKVPAPVVVTSDAATKDLADKKAQTDQLQTDTQNHQAIVTAPASAPTQETAPGTKTDQPQQPQTLDDQINGLLNDLGEGDKTIDENTTTALTPLQQQQDAIQAEFDKDTVSTLKQLKQISTGTYPLSPTEKNLLSSTTDQYMATIEAQKTANAGYVGQMTELMASLGINTSAPTQAIGMVQAAVTSGNSKIAILNGQMATSLADLTQGFQKQDYDMVSDAWEKTSKYFEDRLATLKDLQKSVTDAATQQKKDTMDYTKLALDTIVTSAKFDYQQKQDAIDNMFKATQITETERHNYQTELISQAKLGTDSAGTFTRSQKNVGAEHAGLDLDEFEGLDSDTKNYFINGYSNFQKLLDEKDKGDITVSDIQKTVKESNLSDSVKKILYDKIGVTTPEAIADGTGNLWDDIGSFVGAGTDFAKEILGF